MKSAEILLEIEREYRKFENTWVQKSSREVYDNCYRINAWVAIHNFFTEGEVKAKTLKALYEKSNGHIISGLVDFYLFWRCYIDSEHYDVNRYEDVREMIWQYVNAE